MCKSDGSHFGDQGLLQKVRSRLLLELENFPWCQVRKGRGTRVSVTASHSSTVAEEVIKLLRLLHR